MRKKGKVRDFYVSGSETEHQQFPFRGSSYMIQTTKDLRIMIGRLQANNERM